MVRTIANRVLVVVVALIALSQVSNAAPTAADDVTKPPRLRDVTAHLQEIAAKDDWREPGWRDAVIERWLDDVLEQVNDAAAADKPRVLPARFGELKPMDPPVLPRGGGRFDAPNNALIVGRDMNLPATSRSIILADGNLRVSHAMDCVLIARGAVYVAHGQGNVIVAGHFVHVSHDGNATPVRNAAGQPGIARAANGGILREVRMPGSVILSGGAIDVSHSAGGIYAANDALQVSHAYACAFINPPADASVSNRNDSRDVAAPGLRLVRADHPLSAEITIDWVLPERAAVIRFREKRYVVDHGKPITDESGKPVEALADWKLSFSHDNYVIFTDGKSDFGVAAPPRTR